MRFENLFFYLASVIVIGSAFFLDKKILMWIKPIVPIALGVIYILRAKRKSMLYPVSLVFITLTDLMVYNDFLAYFDYIAISLTIFYVLCALLLKNYINWSQVEWKRIFRLPFFISALLIGYLLYALTLLTWEKVADSLGFLIVVFVGLLVLVFCCFNIFIRDLYKGSVYAFIAGCSSLVIDALVGINELSFSHPVITGMANIAEIIGLYCFLKFLLDAAPYEENRKIVNYF